MRNDGFMNYVQSGVKARNLLYQLSLSLFFTEP